MRGTVMAGVLLLPFSQYPATALAESGGDWYYGLQLADLTYEQEDVPDLDPPGLVFRIGYTDGGLLAYEGRVGAGLSSSDVEFDFPPLGDVEFEIEIDHLLGAYLMLQTDLTPVFSVYGIIGVTRVEVTSSIETTPVSGSVTDSETGLSFGIGTNFGSSDAYRFNVEYMSYVDESDFSLDAISIGVQF